MINNFLSSGSSVCQKPVCQADTLLALTHSKTKETNDFECVTYSVCQVEADTLDVIDFVQYFSVCQCVPFQGGVPSDTLPRWNVIFHPGRR